MTNSSRYIVEHQLLPDRFFNSGPVLLLDVMGMPGTALMKLYDQATSKCQYTAEQFSESHQEFFREPDALLVIRVGMPTPSEPLECRAVYLCYSRLGSNNMLFTSELAEDGGYYLCGYDWNNKHLNFGKAPESVQDETDNVASFFWEMMNNDGSDCIQKADQPTEQRESLCAS